MASLSQNLLLSRPGCGAGTEQAKTSPGPGKGSRHHTCSPQYHQDYSESQTGLRDRGFQQISEEKAKEGVTSLEKTAESPEYCL